jgi:DMSO/TMAO reductase YedYZ molybdopterin-dependent catalytic subunit
MAEESDEPPESKLTRTKQRWAREGRFLTGKTSRPEEQRLPPGQHLTMDWPVLDLGLTPKITRERWRLDVYGAVDIRSSGIFHSSQRSRRPNWSPTSIA